MRRVAAILGPLLVVGLTAPTSHAAESAGQFRFSRESNYQSALAFSSENQHSSFQVRAGSGSVTDECAINFGWLPKGAYDVLAHDTGLDGTIAGYAWELSDHQCYDGTFRTDLLIHSEMSADGGQDGTWEPNVWTFSDPNDYASFGCIKVSYPDALALELTYQEAEEAGYGAQLVVE
jgi:hypothetical protein